MRIRPRWRDSKRRRPGRLASAGSLVLGACLLGLGLAAVPGLEAEDLHVGFYDEGLPPFQFEESSPKTGIFRDILDAISESTGDRFIPVWAPLARIRAQFEEGAIDLLPGTSASWEMSRNPATSRFTRSYLAYRNVVVFSPGKAFEVKDAKALRGHRIGTVRYYEYPGWSEGIIRDDAPNEEYLLLKLERGRYDVAFVGEVIAQYWNQRRKARIELGPVIQETDLAMLIHERTASAFERIDRRLKELLATGRIERIVDRYTDEPER